MGLNLKRILTCIILAVLTTLSTHTQTLCVIGGTLLSDSFLHVVIDKMRSDSARGIMAKRLELIPPYVIESTQIFITEERIKQGKNITSCESPKDIIIMRINSLVELQWVIDGKLRKPRKKLTIIDCKLSLQRIVEVLPEDIKLTGIGSINIITYVDDPQMEKHPTIVTKTGHKSVSKR